MSLRWDCLVSADNVDRIIVARLSACPHCDAELCAANQLDFYAYDHIDLPSSRPIVTRIHCHRGICPCGHRHVAVPAPDGSAPGLPFGLGLRALILHLHVIPAIDFERLDQLMFDVFGLAVSWGGAAQGSIREADGMTAEVP